MVGLHNLISVPQYGICVKIHGGIKPQFNPLLSVIESVYVYICLQSIRLSNHIPQEFEVDLVVIRFIRSQLHAISTIKKKKSEFIYMYVLKIVNSLVHKRRRRCQPNFLVSAWSSCRTGRITTCRSKENPNLRGGKKDQNFWS